MHKLRLSVLLAVLAIPGAITGQLPGIGLGAGIQLVSPSGDFGEVLDAGYGGYLKVETRLPFIGVAAEVNANRFGGDDSKTILGVQVGPRLGMGLLRLGFDIGRYSQIDKTGYTPNVTASLGPLEVGAGMTFFSGGRWAFVRGGIRF